MLTVKMSMTGPFRSYDMMTIEVEGDVSYGYNVHVIDNNKLHVECLFSVDGGKVHELVARYFKLALHTMDEDM